MSKTVDTERAKDARLAAALRAEEVLRELQVLVRARIEGLPEKVILERMQRSERTMYRRQALLELLATISRKGSGGRSP